MPVKAAGGGASLDAAVHAHGDRGAHGADTVRPRLRRALLSVGGRHRGQGEADGAVGGGEVAAAVMSRRRHLSRNHKKNFCLMKTPLQQACILSRHTCTRYAISIS